MQFTLRVGDGMVELGPDAAESAQAQPFYFAEDLWSGVVVGDAGGRLLSREIRFCSRWPAFPLAGGCFYPVRFVFVASGRLFL